MTGTAWEGMPPSGLLYTCKLLFLAEVGGEHQAFLRKQASWKKVGAALDADPVSVTVPGSNVRHTRGSKNLGAYSDAAGGGCPKRRGRRLWRRQYSHCAEAVTWPRQRSGPRMSRPPPC